MSLQSIINIAESIEINRRRIVGIQFTRNEIVRVSETPGRNPWRMTVKVSAALPYEQTRSLIEQIDATDRSDPETIKFNQNPGLSYLFGYQGSMNTTNINTLTVASFTGTNLVLGNLPTSGAASIAGSTIFRSGDFIQIKDFPFPFTVRNDVLRGTSSTVTVSVHRPNFIAASVVGKGINVGNDVEFQMLCTNMPTYTISPGGRNAIITFNGDFELYEFTGVV
jgi:hypothetical protein